MQTLVKPDFVQNARNLIQRGYYNTDIPLSSNKSLSDLIKNKFCIMGELKINSPTSGLLLKPEDIIPQLEILGKFTDAISILTEPTYFRGSLKYLKSAKKYKIPILMKDIIIDTKQIDASQNASTILLIEKFLSIKKRDELIDYTHTLDKEVILEVDNEREFINCLDSKSDIVAINNRNLKNLKIDHMLAARLIEEYNPNKPTFAFSGYSDIENIKKVYDVGASGVIIGTHLSKLMDPEVYLSNLKKVLLN